MRPTLGHTRPFATRYRPAPPVPGSLAWTVAELYREPMQTLRDREGDALKRLVGYAEWNTVEELSPVWFASEAAAARTRDVMQDWIANVAPYLPGRVTGAS